MLPPQTKTNKMALPELSLTNSYIYIYISNFISLKSVEGHNPSSQEVYKNILYSK
jgi:hypothetical protein